MTRRRQESPNAYRASKAAIPSPVNGCGPSFRSGTGLRSTALLASKVSIVTVGFIPGLNFVGWANAVSADVSARCQTGVSPVGDGIRMTNTANTSISNTTASAWTGMVPVDDTALYVTDSGGAGTPVLYLNGAYADHKHWRKVIAELGSGLRHITFDERARGKSERSADYSFEACLRDIDAVLAARGVERAILVGWSYGGVLAWHWTDRNPERVAGVVTVDSAPYGLTGPEGAERIRKLFHRMRFLLPLTRPFGMAARMSAAEHAEVNIELNEIADASGPVLERLRRPVRFVVATGNSLGSEDGEMEKARTALEPVFANNPNVVLSAKVSSNHSKILSKDFAAIADAVREIAG
ncbi:alpha/beta fold hydrolase [Nocardia cyriacigeorgica]|nr:alpha/beta hydrolase [Nocardia cyriacigeorgica]